MDKKTIYSKTGKGVLEIKNKAGKLSKDLVKVLTLIDGKSNIADLMGKAKFDAAEMDKAITQLSTGGYIKEFANTSTGVSPGGGGDGGSYVDDLDFTSSLTSSKANPYQSAQTEWRQRESADRAKAEIDAKKKREEEDRLKKEQAAKQAREEAARLTKVEAERKVKEAAAMKMREETERKAKIEAEAMAQTTRDLQKILETERKALEESERKKQEETALKTKQEAEARGREEAERKRKEDEERQRKEAEERKRREEEERKRRQEEEERKRREEEERKRKEEEERKRREEEERKRKEEEERKRREEEERKRKEEEERKRREEEERKRKEEEERKRREEEERKRKEEEERKRREEEERKCKEEEERKRREEEEERKRKEEEARRVKEEEEKRKRKEEEERRKREEEERRLRREEEDRRRQEEDERRRKEDEALEAKEKEENDLRRAEEDRLRGEEDERRREEDEERRSIEDEEAARRREEDDRRAQEEQERERREDEERRAREEEERARAPATAKAEAPAPAPAEFDLSGLKSMEDRIAAEFEKQQEELRKREEEEESRRDQDEQARLAIERAEREEEARQEAERREAEDLERRERMEQERSERETRERKRQEEKEARIRESEERKIASAQERQRQEEMKVESERRTREEALAARRKEQEERDRKRAEVQSLKKSKAIRSPLEKVRPFIIGAVVVVAVLIGGVQLVPMNSYIPAVEKLAADHIKEPVTIGSMKVSILGGFSMNLDNVKLGKTEDVKIERVTLSPDFGSVFGAVKVVRRIDVDSMSVAQEVLPRLSKWMEAALADKNVEVGRIVMKNVKVESTTLELPVFDADLQLSPEGAIERARLSDGKIDVDLKPRSNEVDISVTASKGWVSPLGPKIEFTDFSATAVASHSQVRVSEFKALLYGGAAKGTALINWGGPWSIEGDLSTERINLQELMPVFTQEAKSSGQLESRFRFAMAAPDLSSLFKQPKLDGSFAIRKGDLDGVDLVRALQVGGRENVQGGATRFEEITGTLSLSGDRYQFRNLKLGSGLLSATGGFEVTPNNDISGRTYVELRSQAAQIRGSFNIGGSLKAVVLKPN